ncbi:transmembrane and immunoglobulin domain-containing protein 2 [Arvicola amphibius]|uniref:transmembrane and immunoglobulin domain-containing protein 2 n=1 Tax=Arvicola amphibius TaxID=1047088 RepID=UPI001C097085|nr:transmembrane and immunoglobulin domain-containing protein 2 [Arvicola amphibius]
MGSPGWAFILLQFWGLQEAVSLSVQQWPRSVRVRPGDEMWLSCGVNQSEAWERLRVEWIRDKVVFCHLLISSGNLNTTGCGSRGQLSWQSLTNFSLRLDHLSLNDSGDYVCWATLEIPKLQEAKGNGTKVLVEAGMNGDEEAWLLLVLLVAGGVVAALVVLGAVLWGLRRCRREDSGNSFYSNVLYRPREIPRRPQARPKEKDTGSEQRAQVIYSTAFPKPAPCQQLPVSKPSPRPRPGYPTSVHCASSASRRK